MWKLNIVFVSNYKDFYKTDSQIMKNKIEELIDSLGLGFWTYREEEKEPICSCFFEMWTPGRRISEENMVTGSPA